MNLDNSEHVTLQKYSGVQKAARILEAFEDGFFETPDELMDYLEEYDYVHKILSNKKEKLEYTFADKSKLIVTITKCCYQLCIGGKK